jgi:DNA-binding response OmpR family regulator
MERVLVIDDDIELCELLVEYLTPEGFDVHSVHNGEQGIEELFSNKYALVVLDVMLPNVNGFEILRRIRAKSRTPVIMLTARGADIDRIVGLEIGADDYLPKPFNPRELVARIHAILRRAKPESEDATITTRKRFSVGEIELDTGTRTVLRSGKPVELTAVEFYLLELLLRSVGNVVGREELAKSVLGRDFSPFDRSIDMHVSNLRKKLGRQINGMERIKTVRGTGYIYLQASGEK